MTRTTMIEIFVSPQDKIGYVWNADDWLLIREKFRIVGNLIGALANYPRQDTFPGLPMSMSPEEITLLKENQMVRLVHCPTLFECPHESLKEKFAEQETAFHESQRALYLQKKELEVERSLSLIIKGKQKKDTSFKPSVNQKDLIMEEVNKIQSVSVGNHLSCIPTGDTWIEKSDLIDAEWSYPCTESERLKYDIFKDLWRKNYYLTCGAKFGGDFLCYLGDPVKFHACFIVVCKESNSKLSSKDLIIYGRIGSSTRKTIVIASRNEGSIVYQSVQWIENSNEIKSNTDE